MAGARGLELLDEFVAAEAGHDYVGDDEVDGVGVAAARARAACAVGGFEDAIAAGFESFADELADGIFVFDEEDGFGSAGGGEGNGSGADELRRVRRRAGNKW